MAEIRYADLQFGPPVAEVSGIGTGTNDGWSIIATLNADAMPAGASQLAFVISGGLAYAEWFGGAPQRAVMQVCLGTAAGLRHPEFIAEFPLNTLLGGGECIPWQFLVFIASAYPDSLLGSSIDPAVTELVLWARIFLNGDPQTYAARFRVTDTSWLWWDLGRIPAGHWAADEQATPFTLQINPPNNLTRVSGAPIGAAGQTWLCFGNVWYDSLIPQAPAFRFGTVPDGATATLFQTRVGNVDLTAVAPTSFPAAFSLRWGQSAWPGIANLQRIPALHQGCCWVETITNSTTRPAMVGYAALGRCYRYRWLGIRIDTLPDVLTRYEAGPQPGGVPITAAWQDTYLARERPQPSPGILTEPIVIVHQVARTLGGPKAYGTYVTEAGNGQSPSIAQQAFPRVDQTLGEGASSFAIGRRTFSRTSPAMQWRAHLVGLAGMPAATQQVFDFTFVQFHPVRDPENTPTGPGSRPPAVVLVPGKQSLAVGSLPAPPFPPSSASNEGLRDDRPSIAGTTGYRRRWPVGTKAGRVFALTWTLADADAETLLVWLQANPAWRYTPPRGAAVPVLSTSAPTAQQAGHRSMVVSIEVVVLIYTGA